MISLQSKQKKKKPKRNEKKKKGTMQGIAKDFDRKYSKIWNTGIPGIVCTWCMIELWKVEHIQTLPFPSQCAPLSHFLRWNWHCLSSHHLLHCPRNNENAPYKQLIVYVCVRLCECNTYRPCTYTIHDIFVSSAHNNPCSKLGWFVHWYPRPRENSMQNYCFMRKFGKNFILDLIYSIYSCHYKNCTIIS